MSSLLSDPGHCTTGPDQGHLMPLWLSACGGPAHEKHPRLFGFYDGDVWLVEHDSAAPYCSNHTLAFMSIKHINSSALIWVVHVRLALLSGVSEKKWQKEKKITIPLFVVSHLDILYFWNVKLNLSIIPAPFFPPKWQTSDNLLCNVKTACFDESCTRRGGNRKRRHNEINGSFEVTVGPAFKARNNSKTQRLNDLSCCLTRTLNGCWRGVMRRLRAAAAARGDSSSADCHTIYILTTSHFNRGRYGTYVALPRNISGT